MMAHFIHYRTQVYCWCLRLHFMLSAAEKKRHFVIMTASTSSRCVSLSYQFQMLCYTIMTNWPINNKKVKWYHMCKTFFLLFWVYKARINFVICAIYIRRYRHSFCTTLHCFYTSPHIHTKTWLETNSPSFYFVFLGFP